MTANFSIPFLNFPVRILKKRAFARDNYDPRRLDFSVERVTSEVFDTSLNSALCPYLEIDIDRGL